ncbi:uncharacterized protein [Drosophila bipectinata]|uniref:uncharacterized protein isoform X1 n=1 Tax=Drosophila bipectinata TaxID=42026 RepID=UPI0038B30594
MNSRDRKFWTEFLQLYRSLPAVWQTRSPEYSIRSLKTAGYESLVQKLREVEPEANRLLVVKKINSFRTNFRRDVRRRDQCLAKGQPFQSTLWYFEILGFLEGQDGDKGGFKTEDLPRKKNSLPTILEAKEKTSLTCEPFPQKQPFKAIKEEPLLSNDSCPSMDKNLPILPQNLDQKLNPCCSKPNEFEALAQTWSHQFQELSYNQRILARKLISDILYHGCMERLEPNHIDQMHDLMSRTTTSMDS